MKQEDITDKLTLKQIQTELQVALWQRDDAERRAACLKLALKKKMQPPNKMGHDWGEDQ